MYSFRLWQACFFFLSFSAKHSNQPSTAVLIVPLYSAKIKSQVYYASSSRYKKLTFYTRLLLYRRDKLSWCSTLPSHNHIPEASIYSHAPRESHGKRFVPRRLCYNCKWTSPSNSAKHSSTVHSKALFQYPVSRLNGSFNSISSLFIAKLHQLFDELIEYLWRESFIRIKPIDTTTIVTALVKTPLCDRPDGHPKLTLPSITSEQMTFWTFPSFLLIWNLRQEYFKAQGKVKRHQRIN